MKTIKGLDVKLSDKKNEARRVLSDELTFIEIALDRGKYVLDLTLGEMNEINAMQEHSNSAKIFYFDNLYMSLEIVCDYLIEMRERLAQLTEEEC